jgi:1-acyl-sn-glycerol-3-phosphate acyltransferase
MRPSSKEERFKVPFCVSEIGQRIAWLIGKPALVFFLHFRVYGKENISGLKNGFILSSNHTSEIDPLLILSSFDFFSKRLAVYFVSAPRDFYRDNLFQSIFYTEAIFRFVGAYPAIFGMKNFEKALQSHIGFLHKKRNVVIFPEGKIIRNKKQKVAKGGVVALAKATNALVVPVAISGVSNISFKDFLLRRRYASISFGKPIFTDELFYGYDNPSPRQYSKISNEKIMSKIEEMF